MKLICPRCKKQETDKERFRYSYWECDTRVYVCDQCHKELKGVVMLIRTK